MRFVDAETGERREIEVTPRLAAAYVEAWDAHAAELEHFCGRYDIGYVRADAERPFEDDRPQGVPPGTIRRMTLRGDGRVAGMAAARRRGGAGGLRCSCSSSGRRGCSIPSLLLWSRVLDDTREQTLWERIRRAVSLIVTVIVAIALALALAAARPAPRDGGRRSRGPAARSCSTRRGRC